VHARRGVRELAGLDAVADEQAHTGDEVELDGVEVHRVDEVIARGGNGELLVAAAVRHEGAVLTGDRTRLVERDLLGRDVGTVVARAVRRRRTERAARRPLRRNRGRRKVGVRDVVDRASDRRRRRVPAQRADVIEVAGQRRAVRERGVLTGARFTEHVGATRPVDRLVRIDAGLVVDRADVAVNLAVVADLHTVRAKHRVEVVIRRRDRVRRSDDHCQGRRARDHCRADTRRDSPTNSAPLPSHARHLFRNPTQSSCFNVHAVRFVDNNRKRKADSRPKFGLSAEPDYSSELSPSAARSAASPREA